MAKVHNSDVVDVENGNIDLDVESFREQFHAQQNHAALKRIKDAMREGKQLDAFIVKFITEGKERFREELISFWQTVALVSALIGAISVTVLLSAPARQGALQTNNDVLSSIDSERMAQTFYALFGTAACAELGAVLIVTISTIHFYLMLTDDDMVWFVMKWGWFTNVFCQALVTIGCFALITGCFVGSFIVGDNKTGIIVTAIGGAFLSAIVLTWFWMLTVNFAKQTESVDRIREILFRKKE